MSLVADRIRIPSNSPIRCSSSSPSQSRPSSTSKLLPQQLDAGVGDLLLDEDLRLLAHRLTSSAFSRAQSMQAVRASTSAGIDRREHADPQLVAPQLAVGLGVDDAVRAQRRREGRGVDRVVEVDRPDDQRALRRIGDEGVASSERLRPAVEMVRRGAAPRDAELEAAALRAATRSGRRAGTASPARACCRSAPSGSSRARPRARGRPAASGQRLRRAARSARSRPGSSSASQRPPSGANAFCGAK